MHGLHHKSTLNKKQYKTKGVNPLKVRRKRLYQFFRVLKLRSSALFFVKKKLLFVVIILEFDLGNKDKFVVMYTEKNGILQLRI